MTTSGTYTAPTPASPLQTVSAPAAHAFATRAVTRFTTSDRQDGAPNHDATRAAASEPSWTTSSPFAGRHPRAIRRTGRVTRETDILTGEETVTSEPVRDLEVAGARDRLVRGAEY